MKPEEIRIFDLERMLRGQTPWIFAAEVLLRVVVIYLILVVSMRLMGRRMAKQMSRNELVALVSLAAAVGPAMQAPDRGLLPTALVALFVVGMQRGLALLSAHNRRIEKVTQGEVTTLVADGRLDNHAISRALLSRDRVFAQLRSQGIEHLGQVDRLRLEANGAFSNIKANDERPGLSILPAWDEDAHREQPEAHDARACSGCGLVVSRREQPPGCDRCGISEWVRAVGGPPRREHQPSRDDGRSGARQPAAVSTAPG
ncbi:DUF421 domain-containing protein [Sorangium sp. So ce1078]|uniref:DUF421 domain-containing protein n=1 Tax=Sorangium sp. So ce1078 TaxID=3133329 RepID=UPI003F605D8E